MKRSLVYLESMTPDGKAGAVKEVVYDDAPQMYLEPVPYFSSNDAELDALKKKVAQAETDLRHAQSRGLTPTELLRFEQAIKAAKVELDQAEDPARRQRARETGYGGDDVPPPARQSEDPRRFAEPVAYFAAPVSDELKELRKKLAEAEKALGVARASGSAAQITKLEETVRSLKEELEAAELPVQRAAHE